MKALEAHEESLMIRRNLAKDIPKTHLPDLALTLNNLGYLHFKLNEYSKALEAYEESLMIRRNLAKDSPKTYLTDLAMALNNLGGLLICGV